MHAGQRIGRSLGPRFQTQVVKTWQQHMWYLKKLGCPLKCWELQAVVSHPM